MPSISDRGTEERLALRESPGRTATSSAPPQVVHAHTAQPGHAAHPGQTAHPSHPGHPGQAVHPGPTGRPGQASQPGQAGHPGHPGQVTHPGRSAGHPPVVGSGAASDPRVDGRADERVVDLREATGRDRTRPDAQDERVRLLRLLATGCKDETAARQLGISVRTLRRRVAGLMSEFGVGTRLQLGAEAVRRHLL